MGGIARWRDQIDFVASDRWSGATHIADGCARALMAYLDEDPPTSIEELEAVLHNTAVVVLAGQSVMAPVIHVFNRALQAVSDVQDILSAIEGIRTSLKAFIDFTSQAAQQVARVAIGLLPTEASIMTLSYSAAVVETLLAAQATGRRLRVICLESRPNLEGRMLARRLTEMGIEVLVTIDAACYDDLRNADIFLVGADSLTRDGVVNKVGTALLAVSAQTRGVPGYVLADTSKIWPESLGQPLLRDYGADEVWEDRPDGVIVHNRYFDLAPWQAFAGVVTEEGILGESELRRRCRSMEVHPTISAIIADVRSIG